MIPTSPDDKDFPWWLLVVVAIGGYLFWQVGTNETYARVLSTLSRGIQITIFVTIVSYAMACALGLLLALMQLSRSLILRQISRRKLRIDLVQCLSGNSGERIVLTSMIDLAQIRNG